MNEPLDKLAPLFPDLHLGRKRVSGVLQKGLSLGVLNLYHYSRHISSYRRNSFTEVLRSLIQPVTKKVLLKKKKTVTQKYCNLDWTCPVFNALLLNTCFPSLTLHHYRFSGLLNIASCLLPSVFYWWGTRLPALFNCCKLFEYQIFAKKIQFLTIYVRFFGCHDAK